MKMWRETIACALLAIGMLALAQGDAEAQIRNTCFKLYGCQELVLTRLCDPIYGTDKTVIIDGDHVVVVDSSKVKPGKPKCRWHTACKKVEKICDPALLNPGKRLERIWPGSGPPPPIPGPYFGGTMPPMQ